MLSRLFGWSSVAYPYTYMYTYVFTYVSTTDDDGTCYSITDRLARFTRNLL